MAESGKLGTPESNTTASYINRLRDIAQTHLVELDEATAQDQADEMRRVQELERYAKKTKRQRDQSQQPASLEAKGPRLRSAHDVLNRLQWDRQIDISRYLVGYLERFGGLKETPASTWVTEVTEEEWIPQHRIKYFKRVDEDGSSEIVWDRDAKVDKIFGGGHDGRLKGEDPSAEHGVSVR